MLQSNPSYWRTNGQSVSPLHSRLSCVMTAYSVQVEQTPPVSSLELLLLVEEHAEADDGSVDEETAGHRHDHGLNLDEARVRKNNREGCNAYKSAKSSP